MAVTVKRQAFVELPAAPSADFGSRKMLMLVGTFDFDNSYEGSGGEAITDAQIADYFPGGLHSVQVDSKGGYVFAYDTTVDANKLIAYRTATLTPAGTVAAPVFTGTPMTAHTHALHFNDADVADGAGSRVNIGTNLMGANTGSDISVAGVADTSGAGGVVAITAGTPAGTNSAPAFTGTATTAAALAEVAAATNLSSITGVPFRAYGFA